MHGSPVPLEQESALKLSEAFLSQENESFIVLYTALTKRAPSIENAQQELPTSSLLSPPTSVIEGLAVAPELPRRISTEENIKVLPSFGQMQTAQTEDFLDITMHAPAIEATVFKTVSGGGSIPHEPSAYRVSQQGMLSDKNLPSSNPVHIKKNSIFGAAPVSPRNQWPQEFISGDVQLPDSAPTISPAASTFLETDFDEGADNAFLDRLDVALEKGVGESLKINVMEPSGKFVQCENLTVLNQILEFCKHQDISLAMAKTMKKTDSNEHVMWIDLEGCHFDEINSIGKRLDIHPLTVEDMAHRIVRQKLEPFENYIFVVLRSLHHEFHSEPDKENFIKILVFANLVVSLHFYPSFAINTARSRLRKVERFSILSSDFFSSEKFFKVLEAIGIYGYSPRDCGLHCRY
jgi:hypothetical protein